MSVVTMAPREADLPVAVIGGGPVGLAAAAHLIVRGLPVKVYEAGGGVGHNVRDWGHVRTFSPWRYSIDAAARTLLETWGWKEPPLDAMPSGAELYQHYLRPLADLPGMRVAVETRVRVKPCRGAAWTRLRAEGATAGRSS